MQLQLEIGDDKQHQTHSAPSDVDMNTREPSAAIKKTVVETFPISKGEGTHTVVSDHVNQPKGSADVFLD